MLGDDQVMNGYHDMTLSHSNKDQMIAKLQEEAAALETILATLPGHIYWKNLKGQYLGCNQNLLDTLQLSSKSEILGKTDIELIGSTLGRDIIKNDHAVLKYNQKMNCEEVGFDAERHPSIYLSQKVPLYDDQGEVKGILGISLNVVRIEKNSYPIESQAINIFTRELRTPLTGLLGCISFLQKEKLSEQEAREYLKHINNSGSYVLSLLSNMRFLSFGF
jgi:transcriptional regulator with PAS, ATPase and Fis domain